MRKLAAKAMEMASRKAVILGEKASSSLAPQAVYNVAYRLASVDLDPAALEGVSRGFPRDYSMLSRPEAISRGKALLSEDESRAALAVLLYRLLEAGKVRKEVLTIICEALNSGVRLEFRASNQPLMDFAEVVYNLDKEESLAELKARLLELRVTEFGIAKEEVAALLSCAQDSTSLGVAAISVHLASYIVEFADFVAGLSCEALLAKTSVFDSKIYRQDSAHNSVADAAKVMRLLLLNSQLVNGRKGLDADFITSIPEVHGAFKEACRSISGVLKIEMDRVASQGEKLTTWPASLAPSPELGFLLADAFIKLTASLERLLLSSSKRIREGLKQISDLKNVSTPIWAEEVLQEAECMERTGTVRYGSKLAIFRNAFSLVQKASKILALEAAVALFLLCCREIGTKAQRLGKGTACSRDILIQVLNELSEEDTHVPERWFNELQAFFKPEDDSLQTFIDTVKALIAEGGSRLAQVPKGTRDFGPREMLLREASFRMIADVFKRHGAASLDTPVFELKETLMGKYGEDSKLIYDLADQGGQMLSLRYDLTVPFARYLATKGITKLKRYHIAKVYRRDNPSQGRFREFYQCDFDIAGVHPPMVPDAEVIKVLTELLDELDIGTYEVKLNHRKLLDGMLKICGVPESKFRTICSSIDKLDKTPWEKVRTEMVSEKGLLPEVADRIGIHVARRGEPLTVLRELLEEQDYATNTGSRLALEDLSTLFKYLEAAKCLDRVVFDLSLARGLDYYTGVIFEAVFRGTTQVGSIAAGGRYDNLVGSMFPESSTKSGKPSKPTEVPAVGMSLGIERVLMIKEELAKERGDMGRANETQVQIIYLGQTEDDMTKAIKLAAELWAAHISAEFECASPKKLTNKLNDAVKAGVPFVIFVGSSEEKNGIVKLKDVEAYKEYEMQRENLVTDLQALLETKRTAK